MRILNAELADTMGNLLSRACAKTLNPQQQFPQVDQAQLSELIKLDACKTLFEKLSEMPDKCKQHYSEYNFHFVVDTIMSTLHAGNGFFEATKPWLLKKSDEEAHKRRLETIIAVTFECLRVCGIALQPIIPSYSKNLLDRLNVTKELRFWKDTKVNLPKVPKPLVDLGSNVLFKKIIPNDSKK
jgi:methionyl-tRNA synthetase